MISPDFYDRLASSLTEEKLSLHVCQRCSLVGIDKLAAIPILGSKQR